MIKFNMKLLRRYPTVFLKLILVIFKLNIYFISFLFPRNKNKFVFGSHSDQFADNAKYLYLYLFFYQKNIACYWITTNKNVLVFLQKNGYKACYKYSLIGLYHIATAKFWFFSGLSHNICFWLSGGSVKTNLWHGIGIKNIGNDIPHDEFTGILGVFKRIFYTIKYPSRMFKDNWILTTSDLIVKNFAKCFAVTKNQCINFNYPRNLVINNTPEWFDLKLLSPLKQIKDIVDKSSSVYAYMPTFRDNNNYYIANLITDNIDCFIKLDAINKKLNRVLLIKTHNWVKENIDLNLDTIILIDANIDLYPLFPDINVLITDYSSVYYDVILTNKPTIFFIPDYEYYISQCRSFTMSYFENIDGYICKTFDDLINIYEKPTSLLSITKKTAELKDKFWGNVDLVNDTPLDIVNFVVNNS